MNYNMTNTENVEWDVRPAVENNEPSSFRLMEKKDGSLILQGAFYWKFGSISGFEWRDIKTVIEGEEE